MASFERPPITHRPSAIEREGAKGESAPTAASVPAVGGALTRGDGCAADGAPSRGSARSRTPKLRLVRGDLEDVFSATEAQASEEMLGEDFCEDEVTEIYDPVAANLWGDSSSFEGEAPGFQPQFASLPSPAVCSERNEMEVRYEFEGASWLPSSMPADRVTVSAGRNRQNGSADERTGDFDMESFYEDHRTDVFAFDDLWTEAPAAGDVKLQATAPAHAISGPFPGDDAGFPDVSAVAVQSLPPGGKRRSRAMIMGAAGLCLFLCLFAFAKRSSSQQAAQATSPHQVDASQHDDGPTSAEQAGKVSVEEGVEPLTEKEVARTTPGVAARSFSVGDYKTALQHYRILARLHPQEPTYPVIVRALTRTIRSQGGRR